MPPSAARSDDDIEALVASHLRDVPDFPMPGVVFKDIAPLLADPTAFSAVIDALLPADGGVTLDSVAGIEARGFMLAAPVALRAGVGFVAIRKKGKLPGKLLSQSYVLEYGSATLEVQRDAFAPGDQVLLVDDVLATGGTVRAAVDLIRRCDADVVGVNVLMELSFLNGRAALPDVDVRALVTV